MKLRSQIIIGIIVFGIVLLIISTSVVITNQQVAQISNQEKMANDVTTGASNLAYISNDYFLYQQNDQLNLWQSQFSSLSTEISQINPNSPEQSAQIDNIKTDMQRLSTVFNSSVTFLESAPRNESVRVLPAFQTAWSRLGVQNQALAFDASVLSNYFENQAAQIKQTNSILIFALLGSFGAYFALIYFLVFKRTFKSINKLQEGTKIIGSGNLDHSIVADSNDEIGELSHAFNQMSANLKNVTASKTDLEQAQASLRESEQRWSTTLASIGDAVIATDLSGKITFMNGEAQGLTGWTLDEASLRPIKQVFNIVNEQTGLEVENPVSKVLENGVIVGLANHTVLIRKDGTNVAIDDSGAPIKSKDGKTTGVVLIFRDITERKKAEEALRVSEEKANALIKYAPTGIYEIDYHIPKFKTVNDAMCKILGMTREELLATSPLDVLDEESKVRFKERIRKLLSGEKVDDTVEFRVKPKDGQEIYAILNVMFTYKDGKPDGALVVAHDVTERRKMQNKLEEYSKTLEDLVEKRTHSLKLSEEKYRTLFDSIDEGFCIVEMIFDKDYKPLDYRLLEINSSFERQTGMHDAKGKLMRSFAPNHEQYWFEIYGKVALTGQSIRFTNEAKALNRYYDVFAFPVGEGAIRKVGILFNDISQRKNLEKQLQDSERLATIGATAGMVGHDIRNPLQAITGDIFLARSELASTPESDEKKNALENLTEIEKNIDYINKIVADLQDYARPLTPKIEEIDFEQTVHHVIGSLKIPGNVSIKHSIRRDFPKLKTDPSYIQRILTNLANNAIQAMPNGGKLTITATRKGKKAFITVEDNGEGIPENVRSKLFTPLVTTKSKGQGFGLAVVKRLSEGLGGKVSFESEVGKGTKFIIEFPT